MGARHRRGNQFLNGAQKYNRLHCKLDFPLRQCLTQLAAHFSCLWMWATAECLPCARAGTELRVGLLPTITVPINWNIHLLERLWSSQVREWSAVCIHYFSGEGALLCAFYSLTESVCLACSCFFFFSSFRRGGVRETGTGIIENSSIKALGQFHHCSSTFQAVPWHWAASDCWGWGHT